MTPHTTHESLNPGERHSGVTFHITVCLSICHDPIESAGHLLSKSSTRAFIHNKSINKLSRLFVESTHSSYNTERTISKPLRLTTGNINKHYIVLYLSIPRAATTPKDDEPTGISITERCCYFYTKKNTTFSRLERFCLLLLCSASIFSRKTYTLRLYVVDKKKSIVERNMASEASSSAYRMVSISL